MCLAGERMGQMQARGGWCVGSQESVQYKEGRARSAHRECRARRRGQVDACGLVQIEGGKRQSVRPEPKQVGVNARARNTLFVGRLTVGHHQRRVRRSPGFRNLVDAR